MPGHDRKTQKKNCSSRYGGTRKQRGGFGFLKKFTDKAKKNLTAATTAATRAAPVIASTIVPTSVNKNRLMDDLRDKKNAALTVINTHRKNAISATEDKKKQIAEKLGKMAAHHKQKGIGGYIITYGTEGEPGHHQVQSWTKGQQRNMHNHIARVAEKVGKSVHLEAFKKGFTGTNQEPLTKGGKRNHKRKTMKRKSNKHKHKKRHATKKRGHKKHGHKKRHATKKRGHKKRKQRGGNCGCEMP